MSDPSSATGGGAVVSVMTYNVYGARFREPLRTVIRAVRPDILIVNETPKEIGVWRWRCDRLATSWGLRRAAGGRDAGSNMICVSDRVRVESSRARRLPQPRFAPRRGIVSVQCEVAGHRLGVVGVHLSLLDWSRPEEARQAVADAAALTGPLVLAGDFNERPDRISWRTFREAGFVDHAEESAYTSNAREPVKRIDGLLVRGAQVISHRIPDLPADLLAEASDHLPVVAMLDLGRSVEA